MRFCYASLHLLVAVVATQIRPQPEADLVGKQFTEQFLLCQNQMSDENSMFIGLYTWRCTWVSLMLSMHIIYHGDSW